MPTTTNLALPYPALSSAPNVPSDMAALAAAIDAEYGAWTTYTPTVYTAMGTTPTAISSGSITVVYAKYTQIGKLVHCRGTVTVNTTTSGGCAVSLPVTAYERIFDAGSLWVTGASASTSQIGVASFFGTAPYNKIQPISVTNAFMDVGVSGQQIKWNVTYEAA